ncbi:TnpV protein [Brachybacterium tyrofermentans]|uniref:TnpV protein n=1 Tax=Brachybacterium tyrofermentans TaxID=47848 RepID=UPI003FCF642A
MNKYAAMLRRQWEIADPTFVTSLDDPTEHFSQMGEQVQNEISELLPSLEGTDPAGESYLQKVGRLNAAKSQAEEIVLTEYQPPSNSPDLSQTEDPDNWASQSEQENWIRETFASDQDEMQDRLRQATRQWEWREIMTMSRAESVDEQ